MVKKAVAFFASPLIFVTTAVLLLTVLSWCLRKRWYLRITLGALATLYVLSTPIFSVTLMLPLEKSDSAVFQPEQVPPNMKGIVVLACRHVERDDFPLVSQYGECSLRRNAHGVLLHKKTQLPLYFTGGLAPGRAMSEGRFNQQFALAMGVRSWMTRAVVGGVDTKSEAEALKTVLPPSSSIVLVTTASHMKRARRYFEDAGFLVTPSPTDHKNHYREVDYLNPTAYLPNTRSLKRSELAIYEYLGLVSQLWFD